MSDVPGVPKASLEEAPAEDAPAEESGEGEMDPELAALMKDLEKPAAAPAAPAAEEMDPELAALMKECGLRSVSYWPLTFGIATLYIGEK